MNNSLYSFNDDKRESKDYGERITNPNVTNTRHSEWEYTGNGLNTGT